MISNDKLVDGTILQRCCPSWLFARSLACSLLTAGAGISAYTELVMALSLVTLVICSGWCLPAWLLLWLLQPLRKLPALMPARRIGYLLSNSPESHQGQQLPRQLLQTGEAMLGGIPAHPVLLLLCSCCCRSCQR